MRPLCMNMFQYCFVWCVYLLCAIKTWHLTLTVVIDVFRNIDIIFIVYVYLFIFLFLFLSCYVAFSNIQSWYELMCSIPLLIWTVQYKRMEINVEVWYTHSFAYEFILRHILIQICWREHHAVQLKGGDSSFDNYWCLSDEEFDIKIDHKFDNMSIPAYPITRDQSFFCVPAKSSRFW